MADSSEGQVDRFIEGSLSPEQARELAQAALDHPELFEELTFQGVAKASLLAEPSDTLRPYLGASLSPPAQRQLAQAALDNEDLFDALVAQGAVETSLQNPAFREALARPAAARAPETPAKVLRFPHKARAIAIGSVAAALAVVGIYSWKSLSSGRNPTPGTAANVQAPVPSLDFETGRPTLLAADLHPGSGENGAVPVFRGADTDSRAPQPTGTILSVEDRQVTISLGSLDGLTKGAVIEVLRGANSTQPIARLQVTTVFRDRARGSVTDGQSVEKHDRVRAQRSVYLSAVLDEINRLAESGDPAKAREMARNALTWADSVATPAGAERKILERLGALDYQAGDEASAEKDYRSAVASFPDPPAQSPAEQAATLNSLGVLYLLRSDYEQAEVQLNAARAKIADGPLFARTLNNLGVLAELRGDVAKANVLYRDALAAFGSDTSQDRKAVDANLARLGSGGNGKR